MTTAVTLTWREVVIAADVGVQRRVRSLAEGLDDSYGYNGQDDVWTREVYGALAEMAVAKRLGVYWDAGVNTFKAPDVGSLHVRHTQRDDGCLIVRAHDPDAALYVLVTGRVPAFVIRGAIHGTSAKRPEWMRDPGQVRPAYFVPQSALSDALLTQGTLFDPRPNGGD